MTDTIQDRVSRGVAWLDANYNNWVKTIYLARRSLDMSHGCNCVLGILNDGHDKNGYDIGLLHAALLKGFSMDTAKVWAIENGFDSSTTCNEVICNCELDDEYDELQVEWLKVINERRALL